MAFEYTGKVNAQPNAKPKNYKVSKFEFDTETGKPKKVDERIKPTEAAAWGKQPPTMPEPKELPDSAVQPLEEEKTELTATEKWEQLDEITRTKVQEYHEQHQNHELEVQTLEEQLSMVTKFFDKRLKKARQKLADAKSKLGHTRYKNAAAIYEKMQAEQAAPEDKEETVREMMDRRDQLKKELGEINSSWMRRLLRAGKDKAKELQEIENRLQHPMYRTKKIEQPEPELEPKVETPRYTEYDYKQNYLRLVREKGQTEDETEQDKIESQITAIRKEMAMRDMEDPEVAFAPKQEVKTYTIPEEVLEPAREEIVRAEEGPIPESEEMKVERKRLETWLEIAGLDPNMLNEYLDREVDAFEKMVSIKIKETYNSSKKQAFREVLGSWENYIDLLMNKEPRNKFITEPNKEAWGEKIVKGEQEAKFKSKIVEVVNKLQQLQFDDTVKKMLGEIINHVGDNALKKIIPESYNIREEILKLSTQLSTEEFTQVASLYNELRNQLKLWQETTKKASGPKVAEKELEIVSSREIRAERGRVYEVQHGGIPRQKTKLLERRAKKEAAKTTEVIEEEGVTMYINGDDVYSFDPNLGIGIIADGTTASSYVPEGQENPSRQMARIGTLGLAKLFQEAQRLSNPEEKKSLIEKNLDGLIDSLIEGKASAGTMLLGTLYLPETNQLLVVDIGNCQLAAKHGGKFVPLKTQATKEGKGEPIKILKNKGWDKARITDERTEEERSPYVYLIDLDEYTDEQGELRLLLGSDGYEESAGEDLATAGSKLVAEGVSGAIKRTSPKDDISIVDLHILVKTPGQPVAQTA